MEEERYSGKLKQKPGILRLDISKPRRSSGGSVEFRSQPELLGEPSSNRVTDDTVSPQPSVKWDFPPHGKLSDTELKRVQKYLLSSSSDRSNKPIDDKNGRNYTYSDEFKGRCFNTIYMEPASPLEIPDYINSEDDDYSISVSAVMQRRASVKGHRKKGYISPRRASSPMGHVIAVGGGVTSSATASGATGGGGSFDRRRSSVYTTSSGETAISMGDGTHNQESTKEQIFENIRLHKEVLQSVKLQPWSMRRKLRLVRQAKEYVAKHEGALQERFAMSRSTKDLWARFKILLAARLQHYKRELANISTVLIPWELRIKEIESHFGSVVASYFIFLRWLFWVNIVIAVALTIFVVMPEFLATQWPPTKEDHRKNMLPEEKANATRLISIWDFEGFLKYSPLFYGYYSDISGAVRWHYDLPLAYFLTGLVVYIYSFWATLRKMAENSRMSKLSSKDDECVFSWKLFTGWDYMIGHAETAHNRIASVVLGFKEALLEEAEKKKDKRNWKIIVLRGIVNLLVLQLLTISAFAVVTVVNRSTEEGANDSYWRRNEITVVITAISFFFPMFFEGLGLLESYHPRKQLRMQLARIMALNLLNLYALIIALFDKIGAMNKKLIYLKKNITQSRDLSESQPSSYYSTTTTSLLPHLLYANATESYFDIAQMTTVATSTTLSSLYDSTSTVEDFLTSVVPENITHCYRVAVSCSIKAASVNRTSLLTYLLLLNSTPDSLRMPVLDVNTTNADIFVQQNLTSVFNASDNIDDSMVNVMFNGLDSWYSNYTLDGDGRNSSTNISWNVKREAWDSDENATFELDNNGSIYEHMSEIYAQFIEDGSENGTTEYPEVENSTDTQIYATFASYIGNITAKMDFDNVTDYEEFVTEAFTEYLEKEHPIIEECYVTVCEDLEQITLPYSEEGDKVTTTEIPIESTTVVDFTDDESLFPNNYTFEYATSSNQETTTTAKNNFSPMDAENSTQGIHAHESLTKFISHMEPVEQLALRKLCWETMFGQELVKLTVMDLVATITSTIFMDFFRALFVRFFNKCWCWDLEKSYPKYGDFKIAENILHLVNNQGQVWMGMFFSPGLAILNLVKLVIIMYLRSWTVLTCNVPHEVVFRASRSNNFYLALLLTMLFLCVLPVGYAIVWLRPSWHCGPFSKYDRIYLIFTDTLRNLLPLQLHEPLDYIASPSTVIPLLLLLILIIYYLVSLTGALREANQDLRIQLRRERTEGRKKMLKLPKTDDTLNDGNPMDRWRKLLVEASSPLTPTSTGMPAEQDDAKNHVRKELLARIMKKALRKGSNTSDDDSAPVNAGEDETDTEQHESLPRDKEVRRSIPKMLRLKAAAHRNSIDEKKTVDQPSRKPSMAQMLKMAAKKEAEHPCGRFKVEKVIGAPVSNTPTTDHKPNSRSPTLIPPQPVDFEEENRMKVGSERRRSILLRQNNLIETGPSRSTDNKEDTVNYKVINEKNKEVEKRAKYKTPKTANAEVFHFENNEGDVSDDDNTSYREIEFKNISSSHASSSQRSKCQSSSDTSWNQDTEDTCRESISPAPVCRDSSPEYAVIVKKSPGGAQPKSNTSSEKPKRRFSSFLTLVREVITMRKQEIRGQSRPDKDLADSIREDDEYDTNGTIKKRRDSRGSRKSQRKRTKTDPKRQDSQTSIWSDNIPVITISKTESDECILEANKVITPKTSEKKHKEHRSQRDDRRSD